MSGRLSPASRTSSELAGWATASEGEGSEEEQLSDYEGEESPPMLPGERAALGTPEELEYEAMLARSQRSDTEPDWGRGEREPPQEPDEEVGDTEAVIAQVLQLRRDVAAVEALARVEAIELEWLRARARDGDVGAKIPKKRGGEGAEQRRRRLALESRAKLESAQRPAPRARAVAAAPPSSDGPRLNKAATLRRQRSADARKTPERQKRLGSTEWADVPPRYLTSTATSRAHSPPQSSRREAASSSPADASTPTLDLSVPRLNRAAELRQQQRERAEATPSREAVLKEAATRARKSYLKPPPGLDLVAPSPRSAQVVDSVFMMMDRYKLRTVDLLQQLDRNGSGAVDAGELQKAFAHHGVEISDDDVQGLMRTLDKDGNGEIDAQEFIEEMRKLRGARRKLPGDLEVAVSPDLVTRVNSCGVESRKLAALRLKMKAHSYGKSGQDPAKVFQHFDRDNTGFLDQSEFTAAVRKVGKMTAREIADEDLCKLFNSLDLDGGGDIGMAELTGFIFGSFDFVEERTASGVRLSQNSPVRTPRQARQTAKTVAEELRMQRLGTSPAHWAVEVVGSSGTAARKTRNPVAATTARLGQWEMSPISSRPTATDNATTNAELEAAARRIQAAARGHNARKPPLLPDDSESNDETQSDDGTPPTKRDSGTPPPKRTELRLELQSDSVAEATQHQDRTRTWEEQAKAVLLDATTPESATSPTESEPGRVKQSVSAVLSRADAEIGYGTVLKIAEEARRQSPSWTLKSEVSSTVLEQQTADAVAQRRWDQSPGWSPRTAPTEPPPLPMVVQQQQRTFSHDTKVAALKPLVEGLTPSASAKKDGKRKEAITPMTQRERREKQAQRRAAAKAREAARRQNVPTNVTFDEAVECVRSGLSCQLRASVVDSVSSLLEENGQRGAGAERRGRYVPVAQVEHMLRKWSREWRDASHDGNPLHGFDSSVVRLLSHHLVKTCHQDQTRLTGLGVTGELADEAIEADKSSAMIQYIDVLQLVEVLHGPQTKPTLKKVLAMLDPDRFSPTGRADSGGGGSSSTSPRPTRKVKGVSRHLAGIHGHGYHLSAEEREQREQASVLRQLQQTMHSKRTLHGHSIADSRKVFHEFDTDHSGQVRTCNINEIFRIVSLSSRNPSSRWFYSACMHARRWIFQSLVLVCISLALGLPINRWSDLC